MRRVVVTGMGIVSSIGNNTQEVLASLHSGRSGISRAEKYAELGFRSQVQGAPTLVAEEMIDRRAMRFHGGGTAWNHVAMDQAIRDSRLEAHEVSDERTGLIMGFWRTFDARHRRGGGRGPREGPQAGGALRCSQIHVLDRLRDAFDLVQDQGRQLLDFVRLRDLQPLHRNRL